MSPPDGGAPRSDREVRTFFDRWVGRSNAGDWDAVASMMHADIVLSDPMVAEAVRGRPAALERAKAQYEPFPDGVVAVVGDPFVALSEPELSYHWRFTGTHLRPVRPPGFAPTGRRVEVDGTSVLRFRDGQVAAVSLFFDSTTVARQLLAAPAAGSRLESLIALGQRVRVRARGPVTGRHAG